MYISPHLNLLCPLDGKYLTQHDNQLICAGGHYFDIARQGYVNLLPVQYKKSKNPGDSKAMVDARHRFLESGYYENISKNLNSITTNLSRQMALNTIFDAGCGEGYYLTRCFEELKSNSTCQGLACIGMDISKPAIISAAKRHKGITWVVGTNKHPPFEQNSIDAIICMFGFYDIEVFLKILQPDGYLILADPGDEHLIELRRIIYSYIKETSSREEILGFDLVEKSSVKYTIQLERESLADLMVMTPHLYKASKEGKETIEKLSELGVTVDVVFRVFKKK